MVRVEFVEWKSFVICGMEVFCSLWNGRVLFFVEWKSFVLCGMEQFCSLWNGRVLIFVEGKSFAGFCLVALRSAQTSVADSCPADVGRVSLGKQGFSDIQPDKCLINSLGETSELERYLSCHSTSSTAIASDQGLTRSVRSLICVRTPNPLVDTGGIDRLSLQVSGFHWPSFETNVRV